jgi:hypothetical protein
MVSVQKATRRTRSTRIKDQYAALNPKSPAGTRKKTNAHQYMKTTEYAALLSLFSLLPPFHH